MEPQKAAMRPRNKSEEMTLKSLIPSEYHDFLPLFTESTANKLAPHRLYDHHNPLKDGFDPRFGPLYSLP